MTELEKARYNATKKAKDDKAKIKQALPIEGLLNFLEGGARPRAIVGGLLGGDTTALNGLLGEVKQLADPNYMRNVKGMSEQDAINIALDANPIMAGTMKGNIIDAIAPKTKYELAHELAQKNAVEMLGLPPNNTAMERAKALGFDTPSYHGTNSDFNAFDLSRTGSASGAEQYGSGVYTTTNPTMASGYANPNKDGANVLPLMVKMKSPLSPELNKQLTKQQIRSLLSKSPELDDALWNFGDVGYEGKNRVFNNAVNMVHEYQGDKLLDNLHPIANDFFGSSPQAFNDAVAKTIRKDGVQVAFDNGDKFHIPFNPNQVRSRFAAFDPARVHEADLLGMATPEMLGLLALGSGAGVAYANSRKDKKGNNK